MNRIHRRHLLAGLVSGGLMRARKTQASQNRLRDLWPRTIGALLGQKLWTDRDAYDASTRLMVPLQLAFTNDEFADLRPEFDDFFQRFGDDWQQGDFGVKSLLNRGQFVWLASRYLRLAHATGVFESSHQSLSSLIIDEYMDRFVGAPFSVYGEYEFDTFRDAMEWKLSGPETEFEYYSYYTDNNRFTLSIAADLFVLQGLIDIPTEVFEGRDIGLRALREFTTWGDDGGWKFCVGAQWDHPDFAYAGHYEPFEGMEPAPIRDLGEDTSHHHRVPVMLDSFNPGKLDPNVADEVDAMQVGLATQFVNHVLVMPDEEFRGVRTTNYMDGNNGLYRWNYQTLGEGNGYLPYELSSTFSAGWWALLKDKRVQEAYRSEAELGELTEDERDLYVGPISSRDRNPLLRSPDTFDNGMREISFICAAELNL